MAMLDLFDQQALTEVVRRNIEEEANANDGGEDRAFIGADFAPLVSVASRSARIAVADVEPYGMGQFKAPDSTPPLFKPKPRYEEKLYELVELDEMERFTGMEWMQLNSSDPMIARGALLDLLTRLRIMVHRNDLLTEWMRWEAVKGALSIDYPDGSTQMIDYGMDPLHQPVLTGADVWTALTTADPLNDLFAWSAIGATDAGRYYNTVYLNTVTWRLLVYNETIRSYLSALGRSIMLPTTADMQALMREGTGNFVINDSGYLPDGATTHELTKFIPDNRVLLTPGNTLFGNKIMDVADGQVLIGGDTGSAPSIRQGFQTEVIANPFSKNVFRRAASARIPRVYFPEAFLYGSVGA
jgi:hypothetical protein